MVQGCGAARIPAAPLQSGAYSTQALGQRHGGQGHGEILHEVSIIIVLSPGNNDDISPQMEEILFDVASPHYYGHTLSLPMHLCGQSFRDLVAAFKTDAGVAYTSYGEEFPEFVAVSHTRMYQTQAKNWLNDKALEDIRLMQAGDRI